MTPDMPRELDEVIEVLVQDAMQPRHVHVEIAVHEHVPEARHRSEPIREFARQDSEGTEPIDGRSVIRSVAAGAGHEMGRHVESILGAELEAALHGPERIQIVPQSREGTARVPPQLPQRGVQDRQVTAHGFRVGATGAQRPNSPRARRASCTARIFASWGT